MDSPNLRRSVVLAWTAAAVLGGVGVLALQPFQGWSYEDTTLHGALEVLNSLAGIAVAAALLRRRTEAGGGRFLLLAAGLFGMGVLDLFHAIAATDRGFVILHAMAALVGGLFFALVWMPQLASDSQVSRRAWLPWGISVLCLLLGLWTLNFRETMPAGLENGEFTYGIRATNVIGGVLFIIGAMRLLFDFQRLAQPELLLLAGAATLFGLAGLAFPYLHLWNGTWWFWHVAVRTTGFALAAAFAILEYRRLRVRLELDLAESESLAAALRISESRYRLLFENMDAGMAHCRMLFEDGRPADFVYLAVNPRFGPLTGLTMDVAGKRVTELIPGIRESNPELFETYGAVARTGRPIKFESYLEPLGQRWLSISVYRPEPDHFVAIFDDITDRKRIEQMSVRLVMELERSNAELERFSYVASHDLQEPLRMVASYTQLLARRYKGKLDADADEFIAFAVDGATRMQQMIDDLLAYSRVNTRGQPFAPTESAAALSRALSNLDKAILESGAVVTFDALPTVTADASQLQSVFQNLIGNAIKFRGSEPPRVHVSAKRRSTGSLPERFEWEFSVSDNGIGIDPAYHERIFMVFQRLQPRSAAPGSGIGLSICERVVERHGGRIRVESEPGKGATFFFTIPEV